MPVLPKIVRVTMQKAGLRSARSSQSPAKGSSYRSSEKQHRVHHSWWHITGGDSQLQSGGSTTAFAMEIPEIHVVTDVSQEVEIQNIDSKV